MQLLHNTPLMSCQDLSSICSSWKNQQNFASPVISWSYIFSTTVNHLSWGALISADCGLFSRRRRIWRSQQCFSALSKATGTAAGRPSDLPCCWAYYAAISSCGLLWPEGQLLHPHGSNSIRAPAGCEETWVHLSLIHLLDRDTHTEWAPSTLTLCHEDLSDVWRQQ